MEYAPAQRLVHCQCYLGEGPVWNPHRMSCHWVDIEAFGFYEFPWAAGPAHFFPTPRRVSLVVPQDRHSVILGMQGGIARYRLEERTLEWILDLESERPNQRCNDGACDSMGRLWIGTMDRGLEPGAGSLYMIGPAGVAEKKWENLTISNGMAWSEDEQHFFHIDSPTHLVRRYRFERESGHLQFESDAVRIPDEMGAPDGMSIDAEGMLWIAHWGGQGVYRWNPHTGKLLGKIPVPAPHVTSCAFVGDNLDQLLITTARQDLDAGQLHNFPESGDVFLAKPGVRGATKHSCKL